MRVPACCAPRCDGIADDGTGLCAAHRRSLLLSTKLQDAVSEFLHGHRLPHSAVRPTPDNARKVVDAGQHLAHGLACLISTRFEDVGFDPSPIFAVDLSYTDRPPWRVRFDWQANQLIDNDVDDDGDEVDGDHESEVERKYRQ